MKVLNLKYVKLLEKTFEKYRDIDVLRTQTKNDCEKEHLEAPESIVVDNEVVVTTKRVVSKNAKKRKIISPAERGQLKKNYKKRHVETRTVYSQEEDDYLKHFLKTTPDFEKNKSAKIRELKIKMKRTTKSLEHRLAQLQRRKVAPKRSNRPFTLEEDKLIIDAALVNLRKCKSLAETDLANYKELSQTMTNRNAYSLQLRWSIFLRTWLLQYYHKTLNLQIKPMLANILADNFKTVESIDWKYVTTFKEFKGHTEDSLRFYFFSSMIPKTISTLKKERSKVTLKEIAKVVEENFSKSLHIKKITEQRQMEVIEYFENEVKQQKITNFLVIK